MSKQAKTIEADVRICENDQVIDRCIFAMLVVMIANQSLNDFLQDKSAEDRNYYADLWDRYSNVPVGVLFKRPNFDGVINE
jgi:hypothetical protein